MMRMKRIKQHLLITTKYSIMLERKRKAVFRQCAPGHGLAIGNAHLLHLLCRFGGNMVTKRPKARVRKSINPLTLLDYRCWVEGGKIGTRYPESVTKVGAHPTCVCLKKDQALNPVVVAQCTAAAQHNKAAQQHNNTTTQQHNTTQCYTCMLPVCVCVVGPCSACAT